MKLPPLEFAAGPFDAITDVAGVRVHHVTIVQDGPSVARTGVTAIAPLDADYWRQSVFAGTHSFNGFGEMGGVHWIQESGILTSPICLTSTFSLGVVRDAMIAHPYRMGCTTRFHQPVACETNDGVLNDGLAGHVTREHVFAAIDGVRGGPVEEGCVGGGTGMIAYGFKAGIGTASRQVTCGEAGRWTVGVLVQANHGRRRDLRIHGRAVGAQIHAGIVPEPLERSDGSIVVVIATDAPLLPPQCQRLAKHAAAGLGRAGCFGDNTSGDLIIAFATGNRLPAIQRDCVDGLRMLPNDAMSDLFRACSEAIEAAILNALFAAQTTTGRSGNTAWALPRDVALRQV